MPVRAERHNGSAVPDPAAQSLSSWPGPVRAWHHRHVLKDIRPCMMSGRPFPVDTADGWRICSGSTRLMDAHPILNGGLKDIDVYDCEMPELDAIARNAGLSDRAAIGTRQV